MTAYIFEWLDVSELMKFLDRSNAPAMINITGQKKPLKSKPVNSSIRKRQPAMISRIPQKMLRKFMAKMVKL
jgi:hypothetical protein